jgi:hypothetical protein
MMGKGMLVNASDLSYTIRIVEFRPYLTPALVEESDIKGS